MVKFYVNFIIIKIKDNTIGKCVNTFNHWPPEFHVLIIVGRREIS